VSFAKKNVSDWSGVEAFGGLGNFVLELLFLSYQCFFLVDGYLLDLLIAKIH